MSSVSIFIQWFWDYYANEFKSIPRSTKKYVIEEMILNNDKYIDYEYVQNHEDFCSKCGSCCRNVFKDIECDYFNKETNLCLVHDNQPWDICKMYPYGVADVIGPLSLECDYMIRLFISLFNEVFNKIESIEVNINE